MRVFKISRTYSKSINTRTYGGPDSWLKLESTAEAEVEGSDVVEVSRELAQFVKDEVVTSLNAIIALIQAPKITTEPAVPVQKITTEPAPVQTAPAPVNVPLGPGAKSIAPAPAVQPQQTNGTPAVAAPTAPPVLAPIAGTLTDSKEVPPKIATAFPNSEVVAPPTENYQPRRL